MGLPVTSIVTKGAMKNRSNSERRIVGLDGWASGTFKGCLTLTLMGSSRCSEAHFICVRLMLCYSCYLKPSCLVRRNLWT
ncbi:hypothetical protein SCLCIDRAFT_295327 [Scleroderma citrinum Foug A]|uniref:Uncharacterized protein n=1 Tax=Scleroderma citrinum Foug A TaxID=1036808 RepID=A0A0C2ZZ71_9AGAM|nr:hypothetical protein SCLCIDRAFT_295327 [Scleroderma citrinum Foug A]